MATKAEKYHVRMKQQKQFKKVPHQFNKKVFHWPYCSGCGLVLLKTEATQKRVQAGCESMED